MEFDHQIAIPAILAFAAFFSALPLVIFDAIDFKLCAGIFILGLLTLPLNVLSISGLRDVAIIDVVTLNFSGGTRGIMISYFLALLGLPLMIISFLRNYLKRNTEKPANTNNKSQTDGHNTPRDL